MHWCIGQSYSTITYKKCTNISLTPVIVSQPRSVLLGQWILQYNHTLDVYWHTSQSYSRITSQKSMLCQWIPQYHHIPEMYWHINESYSKKCTDISHSIFTSQKCTHISTSCSTITSQEIYWHISELVLSHPRSQQVFFLPHIIITNHYVSSPGNYKFSFWNRSENSLDLWWSDILSRWACMMGHSPY